MIRFMRAFLERAGPLLATLLLPASALGQPCAEPFSVLFERVSPSVVSLQATKINKAKPQRRFEIIVGSGVVIERDGQVLTGEVVNTPTRFRIMDCPGGKELSNTYAGEFAVGKAYKIRVEYQGGHLRYLVDGALLAQAEDPRPAGRSGAIGLRTWMNDLAIGPIVVRSLP